jgi:hypothetical protein
MADPLRKVRRGEALSIPAEAWNRLMDIARADGSDRLLGDAEQGAARRDLDVALVKNTTSRDLPLWGGITLGAPVFPPASGTGGSLPQDFAERTVLTGVEPAACAGRGAVLLQPLAPGAIGRAVVSGILCCRVRVTASGMRRAAFVPWDASAESTYPLADHAGPIELLWTEPGTGVRYAVAMLGSSDRRFLAAIQSSAAIAGASNRWNYTVRTWAYGGLTATGRLIEHVRNLREYDNTATTADGNSLTSPPTTVGPVVGKVEAWTEVDSAGNCVTLFDRPNPVGCGS